MQNEGTEILYGQDYFYDELLGLKFRISEFSFFQTNTYGAEVLYKTVKEYIGLSAGSDKKMQTVFDWDKSTMVSTFAVQGN